MIKALTLILILGTLYLMHFIFQLHVGFAIGVCSLLILMNNWLQRVFFHKALKSGFSVDLKKSERSKWVLLTYIVIMACLIILLFYVSPSYVSSIWIFISTLSGVLIGEILPTNMWHLLWSKEVLYVNKTPIMKKIHFNKLKSLSKKEGGNVVFTFKNGDKYRVEYEGMPLDVFENLKIKINEQKN